MTFQELGQSIRQKREAVGLTIDDVAARIKISARILRSIEEGSQVGLPHAVYTKSFTRSFGQMVGYDPAELSAALEEVFPADSLDESKVESVLVKNASESYPGTIRRVIALLVVLVVLAALGGGIWYVSVNYGEQIVNLVKQPFSAKSAADEGESAPAAPAAPSGNATESSAVDNVLHALLRNGEGPPQGLSEAQFSAAQAAPGSPASAGVAASRPGHAFPGDPSVNGAPSTDGGEAVDGPLSADGGEAAGQAARDGEDRAGAAESGAAASGRDAGGLSAGGKNQLLLTCVEACWISSRADGARGRDYTLKPGESFALTYKDALELTLGNAGGVSLEHNGKVLGVPGRRGQRVELRFPAAGR